MSQESIPSQSSPPRHLLPSPIEWVYTITPATPLQNPFSMPVTFAEPPPMGRRASASLPFPGRVMTALVPENIPRKKRTSSSSSGRRAREAAGSYTGSANGGPGPVPEDPFADESGVSRTGGSAISATIASGADYERMSPQAETTPLYNNAGDAERQPLLGSPEEERMEVPWAFTLGIAAAIGVATFIILYIWRMVEEEGAFASA